jgi:hypothetical protein
MITEEVVQGPGAIAFLDKDPSAMHRGHEAWLNGLKQVSEKREKFRSSGVAGVLELQEFRTKSALPGNSCVQELLDINEATIGTYITFIDYVIIF